MPPTSAPIDEPATATIWWPCSRSTSMTPICASPRAPPAPSTRAMRLVSVFIGTHCQLQQGSNLRTQRRRRHHLGVGTLTQYIHQHLAGVGVRQFELVAAIGQQTPPPIFLPIPTRPPP